MQRSRPSASIGWRAELAAGSETLAFRPSLRVLTPGLRVCPLLAPYDLRRERARTTLAGVAPVVPGVEASARRRRHHASSASVVARRARRASESSR
jgi:hypothetical protein